MYDISVLRQHTIHTAIKPGYRRMEEGSWRKNDNVGFNHSERHEDQLGC